MIAALAATTVGVMPAPNGCGGCRGVPDIHTFDEQSSNGNLLDVVWTWFESVVLPIL
jgi:hypothetical protein